MKNFLLKNRTMMNKIFNIKYLNACNDNTLFFVQKKEISKFSREKLVLINEEKRILEMSKLSENSENSLLGKNIKNSKYLYSPVEAIRAIKQKCEGIDESKVGGHAVLLTCLLNSKKETVIRGVRQCPGGSMKVPKIAVFTSPAFYDLAKQNGADIIADENTYNNINNGNVDFDLAIATLDVMNQVKNLGRILGPVGLMPSPKVGTAVMPDKLSAAIQNFKKGHSEFRSNKHGIITFALGRLSFSEKDLLSNLDDFLVELFPKKPLYMKNNIPLLKSMSLNITRIKGAYPIDIAQTNINADDYFGRNI